MLTLLDPVDRQIQDFVNFLKANNKWLADLLVFSHRTKRKKKFTYIDPLNEKKTPVNFLKLADGSTYLVIRSILLGEGSVSKVYPLIPIVFVHDQNRNLVAKLQFSKLLAVRCNVTSTTTEVNEAEIQAYKIATGQKYPLPSIHTSKRAWFFPRLKEFFPMAYIPVMDLDEFIEKTSPNYIDLLTAHSVTRIEMEVKLIDLLFIAFEIIKSLAEFHLNGLIHRDLKLNNIRIYCEDEKFKIRIIDFNYMVKKDYLLPRNHLWSTPLYHDIQDSLNIHTDREIKPETDIYSLGIILIELFTQEIIPEKGDYADFAYGFYERRRHQESLQAFADFKINMLIKSRNYNQLTSDCSPQNKNLLTNTILSACNNHLEARPNIEMLLHAFGQLLDYSPSEINGIIKSLQTSTYKLPANNLSDQNFKFSPEHYEIARAVLHRYAVKRAYWADTYIRTMYG